ncbi:MAG TPA: hypothetical protein VE377_09675 [Candidatus Dormibacteraeota bacterium]|nr:hypothetical protein [Candidatus Dormibacteraeota bacterium]
MEVNDIPQWIKDQILGSCVGNMGKYGGNMGGNIGTDGTFTYFRLRRNWGHSRLSPGFPDANLVYRYMRTPPWKQIVIDNLGADFAEDVRKKTPGHALCDVKVEEHAILPLWNQRNIDDENEEDESEQ